MLTINILIFLFGFVYTLKCPFPSCPNLGKDYCEIECWNELPDVGDVKEMFSLTLRNFTFLSDDMLSGLSIFNLGIDANHLIQISNHSFRGINPISLAFSNLKDTTLISSHFLNDLNKSLQSFYVANTSLDDEKIAGIVSQLTNLEKLQFLRFPVNNLTNVTINVTSLNPLYELDLSYNILESVSVEGNIEILSMVVNMFNNTENIKLNTPKLTELYLSYNLLTSLPENSFSAISLKCLVFQYNQITQIDVNAFKNLNNLYWIILSGNPLTGVSLKFPNSITHLTLDYCRLRNFKTSDLGVNSIKYLVLSYNNIDQLPDDFYTILKNVEFFDLNGNNLTNISFITKQEYPHLNRLDLNHNLLSSITKNTFIKASRLVSLDLSNNQLENIDF